MKLIIAQTEKNVEFVVRNSITADSVAVEDHDFLRQVISSFFAQGEIQKEITLTRVDEKTETKEIFISPTEETVPSDFLTNDKYWQQQGGTKGLVIMDCPECGRNFSAFLKNEQNSVQCKCGADVALNEDLARFSYTCKNCGKRQYGKTNSQDATITSTCVCKTDNDLQWNKAKKQYSAE